MRGSAYRIVKKCTIKYFKRVSSSKQYPGQKKRLLVEVLSQFVDESFVGSGVDRCQVSLLIKISY